ncbi:MAG: hypothetical protein FWG30_09705 [Eubacteriaceae bacterium]|nr:hypothetical protein [Eubacteriaceae bacterium]
MKLTKSIAKRAFLMIFAFALLSGASSATQNSIINGNLSDNGGLALRVGEYTYSFGQGSKQGTLYMAPDAPLAKPQAIFAVPLSDSPGSLLMASDRIWLIAGNSLYSMGLKGEDVSAFPLPQKRAEFTEYRIGYADSKFIYIWEAQASGPSNMPTGYADVQCIGYDGNASLIRLAVSGFQGSVQAVSAGEDGIVYITSQSAASLSVEYWLKPWHGSDRLLFAASFPENAFVLDEWLYYASVSQSDIWLKKFSLKSGVSQVLANAPMQGGLVFNIAGDRLFCATEDSGATLLYVVSLHTLQVLTEYETDAPVLSINAAGDKLLAGGRWYLVLGNGSLRRLENLPE